MVSEVFRPFFEASPVSVMFRATLERVLSAEKMDAIFSQAATRQKTGELLFSTCVDLMALVVAKVRKSVHAAYRAQAGRMQVSVRSIYNKLAGIEPQVCQRMVAATSDEMLALLPQLGVQPPRPLAGYDVRVIDGNYLSGTEHRLAELRTLGAAALPGMTLCIYDPQAELVRGVIACEDGHANERSLVEQVLSRVERNQCWVADRNYCFFAFLFGVAARQACFVVRQHPQVVGELLAKRRKLQRVADGMLYEQALAVTNRQGERLVLRRITLALDQPTRFDETEIHLLANLPPQIAAKQIAALYRQRLEPGNSLHAFGHRTAQRSEHAGLSGCSPVRVFHRAVAVQRAGVHRNCSEEGAPPKAFWPFAFDVLSGGRNLRRLPRHDDRHSAAALDHGLRHAPSWQLRQAAALAGKKSCNRSPAHESTLQKKTSSQTPKRIPRKSRLDLPHPPTKKSKQLASKPSVSAPETDLNENIPSPGGATHASRPFQHK